MRRTDRLDFTSFVSDGMRKLLHRHSDDRMYAIGKYVYSLEQRRDQSRTDQQTTSVKQVFTLSSCSERDITALHE